MIVIQYNTIQCRTARGALHLAMLFTVGNRQENAAYPCGEFSRTCLIGEFSLSCKVIFLY